MDDFDYAVTPFPEAIGKFIIPNHPYLFWWLLAVPLLVCRVSAMILCGEEHGRFASNIAYCILPSLLAVLIIWYSKLTKNLTKIIFNIVKIEEKEVIVEACEKLLRSIFSNRIMTVCGITFVLLFVPLTLNQQLYPTPSNNIIHRAKVRDRSSVTVGKYWMEPGKNETNAITSPVRKAAGADSDAISPDREQRAATWGWVQLPLGKVIRLAQEENPKLYEALIKTPQESYGPHPPEPNNNEAIGNLPPTVRHSLDPGWEALYSKHRASAGQGSKLEYAKKLKEPFKSIYLAYPVESLWSFSQLTYLIMMIPLLFMSGATLWCLYGITKMSWCFGKESSKEHRCIWSNIQVNVFPHPSKSISAVGRLLWRVAVIHGSIYSVIMVCKYYTRPDTVSLAIACLFSLVVVALFAVPQLNLHELMVRAKFDKIGSLDTELTKALDAASEDPTPKNLQKANGILELQKTLSEAQEWPCDLRSLAMVVSSVVIPIFMAIFTLYQHFQ